MFKALGIPCTIGAIMLLGGCGGDGGGGSVASVSTVATPTTSTTLADLVASQSFANNAASAHDTIAASANVSAASSTSQALTFSYDLPSNSYTVSTQGRSQKFAPANLLTAAQSGAGGGISVYSITSGTTTDRLTIEAASITGYSATSPQYSGLGYWQRTVTGTGSSDVTVDFFIYGLPSTAAQVPRTGSAAYATSVYGLVSPIGLEARFFQGTGRMDIDFANALMTTSATLSETGIVSQTNYGSGATLSGSGSLSSSANAFTGTVVYTGLNSRSSGTLAGQFYGPVAQNLGASFTTTGIDGSSASGVIWGNENSSLPPLAQTVASTSTSTSTSTSGSTSTTTTAPVTTQSYAIQGAQMVESASPTTAIAAGTISISSDGGATVAPAGLTSVTLTSSNAVNTTSTSTTTGTSGTSGTSGTTSAPPSTGTSTTTATGTVASTNTNFSDYVVTNANGTTAINLYKPGSANTEVALTYMSFGSWQGPATPGSSTQAVSWFTYGLATSASVIQARSGSANYTGVAYGTAYNSATNASAGVTGTATFAINFDMQGYFGSFGLKSAGTDYGTFNASGSLASGVAQTGTLTGVTAGSGTIVPAFYGPAAQEFGGPFKISIPSANTTIVGVAAGKGG